MTFFLPCEEANYGKFNIRYIDVRLENLMKSCKVFKKNFHGGRLKKDLQKFKPCVPNTTNTAGH